ncbi:hypothetical protein K504DRAFT_66753 [Pleomassaria siparia CBS 279.74]|uniref:Uncharacterized protein n=1 Tax=Pleomassaria siparia CBS 279.74 TaxID=1314801 RepID=A0A6G1K1P5_9PLEO|nr:hypothetical protein K504DRAFT_66753 [Pleomassaria siparia CBS 279.74]
MDLDLDLDLSRSMPRGESCVCMFACLHFHMGVFGLGFFDTLSGLRMNMDWGRIWHAGDHLSAAVASWWLDTLLSSIPITLDTQ